MTAYLISLALVVCIVDGRNAGCGADRHRRTRPDDKVRAQMIAHCTAIMPHISISGEMPMTAYLISLALIGLVVIAVSEEFS